jgi:hypothetical protein
MFREALNTLIKYYSSLMLSNLVDDLETTDRPTVRATVVGERRTDVVMVVEVQAVRAVAARRCRPIVAVATDIVETAIAVVAITRSRVPYSRCRTKLAGEVHAFIGAIV